MVHPASSVPPAILRAQTPTPSNHVGTASLSTPLPVLTSFVVLPKNAAVQLVLLADLCPRLLDVPALGSLELL